MASFDLVVIGGWLMEQGFKDYGDLSGVKPSIADTGEEVWDVRYAMEHRVPIPSSPKPSRLGRPGSGTASTAVPCPLVPGRSGQNAFARRPPSQVGGGGDVVELDGGGGHRSGGQQVEERQEA